MTNQEAIEVLKGILTEATEYENAVCYVTEVDREPLEMAIEALEDQKTGHWIDDNDGYGTSCSECGKWYTHPYLTKEEVIYCCKCGAKMVELQESDELKGE